MVQETSGCPGNANFLCAHWQPNDSQRCEADIRKTRKLFSYPTLIRCFQVLISDSLPLWLTTSLTILSANPLCFSWDPLHRIGTPCASNTARTSFAATFFFPGNAAASLLVKQEPGSRRHCPAMTPIGLDLQKLNAFKIQCQCRQHLACAVSTCLCIANTKYFLRPLPQSSSKLLLKLMQPPPAADWPTMFLITCNIVLLSLIICGGLPSYIMSLYVRWRFGICSPPPSSLPPLTAMPFSHSMLLHEPQQSVGTLILPMPCPPKVAVSTNAVPIDWRRREVHSFFDSTKIQIPADPRNCPLHESRRQQVPVERLAQLTEYDLASWSALSNHPCTCASLCNTVASGTTLRKVPGNSFPLLAPPKPAPEQQLLPMHQRLRFLCLAHVRLSARRGILTNFLPPLHMSLMRQEQARRAGREDLCAKEVFLLGATQNVYTSLCSIAAASLAAAHAAAHDACCQLLSGVNWIDASSFYLSENPTFNHAMRTCANSNPLTCKLSYFIFMRVKFAYFWQAHQDLQRTYWIFKFVLPFWEHYALSFLYHYLPQ